MGTEALRTSAIAFAALGGGLTWLALRTAAIPVSSPERLIAELRLAQIAALLLALTAGAYVGIAVAHEARPGVGLDIALAVGFFIVAARSRCLRWPSRRTRSSTWRTAPDGRFPIRWRRGGIPSDARCTTCTSA